MVAWPISLGLVKVLGSASEVTNTAVVVFHPLTKVGGGSVFYLGGGYAMIASKIYAEFVQDFLRAFPTYSVRVVQVDRDVGHF
jgi:hypothetical protein